MIKRGLIFIIFSNIVLADITTDNYHTRGGSNDGVDYGSYEESGMVDRDLRYRGNEEDGYTYAQYTTSSTLPSRIVFSLGGEEDGYTFGSVEEIIEVSGVRFWGKDSFGIVVLKWEVEIEKGITGYKIYRKEGEGYMEIGKVNGFYFVDKNLYNKEERFCYYRLYGITFKGEILLDSLRVRVKKYPTKFFLKKGNPNPFQNKILFKYGIKNRVYTTLKIYNIVGEVVGSFINKELNPGFYVFEWNGKNEKNEEVGSGIYFVELKAGSFIKREKIIKIK